MERKLQLLPVTRLPAMRKQPVRTLPKLADVDNFLRARIDQDNRPRPAGAFLGAGLLAYVIIPGMLVIWDRVLNYMAGY